MLNPKIETLDNGLRIVTTETAGYSVTAAISAGVGSRHEDFSKNGGVSHFLEHLLFKGTKKWPKSTMIADQVDSVGGMHNAYTANDMTSFYIKLPKQHAGLALEILSDMITQPLFDPEELDRERGVIVEEMNVYRDDPSRYIHDLLPELLWPNDPLGKEIIGTEEVIRTISRQSVIDYQHSHYSPDNLVVSVAGGVKHEWVVEQVKQLLGSMEKTARPATIAVNLKQGERLTRQLKRTTSQAHIAIGAQSFPYDHPKDMGAKVMTNILGSGPSSRLFVEIREKRGLAYSVYADYHNFTDTGEFEIYAGVNQDKAKQAVEAILAEVWKMAEQPPTKEEMVKAQNKMIGGLEMAMENTFNIADRFGTRLLLTDKIRTVEETVELIKAVKAQDVLDAAQELLKPERLRMAVIATSPEPIEERFVGLIKERK